jgi:hypothetical protein
MGRHQDFDLSRSLSLRTLEVTSTAIIMMSLMRPPSPGFMHALSTVKSPVFSDIVVIYEDDLLRGTDCSETTADKFGSFVHPSFDFAVFDNLDQMREILDFGVVVCADIWGYGMKRTVWALKRIVSTEKWRSGKFSQVSVTCSPQRSGGAYRDPPHPSRRRPRVALPF